MGTLADNRLRPYTNGLTQHDHPVATILLFVDGEVAPNKSEDKKVDYLSDFTSYVSSIVPEGYNVDSITNSVSGNGRIARLALNGRIDHEYYGVFNNFSLLSVNESSDQIIKVHQNFAGYWSAFFLGKKPQVYSFSGFFLDSQEYPYYQEFMTAYEQYLAGRKCIENKMKMKIMYDGKIVDGFMLNISTTITADAPMMKQFGFSILVADENWVRFNYVPVGSVSSDGSAFAYRLALNEMTNVNRLTQPGVENFVEPPKALDNSNKVSYYG